jgi:hypothetical protein
MVKIKMKKALLFSILFLFSVWGYTQNTHGENFKVDCRACHSPNGWKIDMNKFTYNHDSTGFVLEGEHKKTDCKNCHKSLVFDQAKNECVSCHTDVHSMSVGNDCARCHTAKSWLVDNIPELHEQNGFPLAGAHKVLSCVDCHKSETTLKWDRIGNECVSCHLNDYNKSTQPNHILSGFSTNCVECHEPISNDWGKTNFHYFFQLTLGHDIKDCKACHQTNDYKAASPECISCHLNDYNNAPNHKASGFSTICTDCHNTEPGWVATNFKNHDGLYFPINSGKHQGEWNKCSDCHTTNNYKTFSCTNCHNNQSKLANEHDDENDYKFDSNACYKCHPKGEAD